MTFPVSLRLTLGVAALLAALPLAATAQIKVGVTVSSTGPAASLGIPEAGVTEVPSTTST